MADCPRVGQQRIRTETGEYGLMAVRVAGICSQSASSAAWVRRSWHGRRRQVHGSADVARAEGPADPAKFSFDHPVDFICMYQVAVPSL